jgi:hydroxypyruvate reductase
MAVNTRRILLELFDAALRAVDGTRSVEIALRNFGAGPVAVFAIGKAASAMARGAYGALGERIVELLVITKDDHVDPQLAHLPCATILESAHPVPDERSLAAGRELERRVLNLGAGVVPLFLVSGGSSSLVERLVDGTSFEQLRALNSRGLAAGWDIATLNAERMKLSALKGGGVARLLGGRKASALFISDVPGDSPDLIGSGLLGTEGGQADAIQRCVVANIGGALRGVADAAHAHGLQVEVRAQRFDGDAAATAQEFVAALRVTQADVLAWGGESTVTLPVRHGRGGRNTHLALAAARLMRANESMTILAAGTDGTDGPTSDAGAIVDAGTIERAELGGVDVERAWLECDSGAALEASEDLVHTGPTGTNVGDLLIGIKTRRGA